MQTLEWLATNIFYIAIPYFVIFMTWEYVMTKFMKRYPGKKGYNDSDNLVSNSLGIIKLVMLVICAGYTAWCFDFAYQHRLWTLSPFSVWTWPVLFLAWDFLYYWYHRAGHRIRLFWSEHVNHHSSEYFNFGTALRQATFAPVYSFVYFLPLAWLGFHPLAIALIGGLNLLYQFWIHTETIGHLGWFEKWFNTPSHHRVHHGKNPIYLDKNYGGTLIIFDRWFGTFQPELAAEPVKYGLTQNLQTFNLFKVIFHEVIHMTRGFLGAPTWKERLLWVFGPPNWSPTASRSVTYSREPSTRLD